MRFHGHLTQIDIAELRRYAGLRSETAMDGALVQEAAREVLLTAAPQGTYAYFPYDDSTGRILADPPLLLEGSSIRQHLAGCEAVYLLSVTIGDAIDTAVQDLFAAGKYALGVLFDAGATTAVEQIADQLNALIRQEAKQRGFETTWRFSPGYGDWPLTIQPDLLAAIDGAGIGVRATESLLLSPRKSVTAVIGCYRASRPASPAARGCQSCTQKACAYSQQKG